MSKLKVRRVLRGSVALLGVLSSATVALGQTWVPARTTPSLSEVVAIDATGETNWPFGEEDVAGDGLDTFDQPERSVDVRSTYVVATATELWARAYVSDTATPDSVSLYVFIDADRNRNTGGSAAATDIDDRFTMDPTNGGYEYVVGVGGNEMVEGVWSWDDATNTFVPVQNPNVVVESGVDFDPLWLGGENHGYVQFRVPLDEVGLTAACNADLFVRSLSSETSIDEGDLNVGAKSRCITVDSTAGTPPIANPPDGCTSDAQCPGQGLCVDGECVIPPACRADADCDADERCNDRGFCEVVPGNMVCDSNADCGDLVCDLGAARCIACSDDASCGAGHRCTATGRCIEAVVTPGTGGNAGTGGAGTGATGTGGSTDPNVIAPGEKVQGGAFTCAVGFAPAWGAGWAALGLFAGLGLVRRRATRGKVVS